MTEGVAMFFQRQGLLSEDGEYVTDEGKKEIVLSIRETDRTLRSRHLGVI
jgi:hypothetical protein